MVEAQMAACISRRTHTGGLFRTRGMSHPWSAPARTLNLLPWLGECQSKGMGLGAPIMRTARTATMRRGLCVSIRVYA